MGSIVKILIHLLNLNRVNETNLFQYCLKIVKETLLSTFKKNEFKK